MYALRVQWINVVTHYSLEHDVLSSVCLFRDFILLY